MNGAHTAHHVACLVEKLPLDACVRVDIDSDAAWTLENVVNASILNSLNALIYGIGGASGAEPALIGPKWLTERGKHKLPASVMTIEALMQELSKPRTNEPGKG